MTVPKHILQMDDTTVVLLREILEEAERQYKAIAALKHATEIETEYFLNRASVAQMAYLQLMGIDSAFPDWEPLRWAERRTLENDGA